MNGVAFDIFIRKAQRLDSSSRLCYALKMKLTAKQLARFWNNVDVQGVEDCWEWKGYKNPDGYGVICISQPSSRTGRLVIGAHRVSAYLAGMNIDGLCVCHHCDNRRCVNPQHLFLGTYADNTRDMISKGRNISITTPCPGSRNGRAKLTEAEVLQIRALNARGVTKSTLADQFGVHADTIHSINSRKTWRHI